MRSRPPTTETPARAELTPYETAAALDVELALADPELVADPTPDLASAVVMQVYLPRITWAFDFWADSLSKVEQSIWAVDWILKPPETRVREGKRGVEKFPEKSMAPPTVERDGRSIPARAELLAIWTAPATVLRRGREMLAS
jgi:hypothetical protein